MPPLEIVFFIIDATYEKNMYGDKMFFERKSREFREICIFPFHIILFFHSFVKRKYTMGAAVKAAAPRCYLLRKDLQSVHWSWVGFASWVPTRIRSREQ